ncbi:MAG: hypothetical protein MN733_33765 [Nitrososphaera sp.]|nr:hypothetical protein [Nitrososphaera sp.]
MSEFSERLSKIKKDCRLYNSALARWLGVPPVTLQRWLSGKHVPGGFRAREIEDLLTFLELHAGDIVETAFQLNLLERIKFLEELRAESIRSQRLPSKGIAE